MKKIVVAVAVIALASGSWFAYNQFSSINSAPQKSDKAEKKIEKKEARGMAKLFGLMRNDPATGSIPLEAYYQARYDAKQYLAQGKRGVLNLVWDELGPDNQGGRTRAFLIDRNNPNKMYAGGVSGGLWVTTNSGASWNKVNGTDDFNNMIISCITQAQNGNIYFGTGESFGFGSWATNVTGATGFPGGGVWKSTDGVTWANITPDAVSPNSVSEAWSFVNDIVADAVDPNIIWVGIKGKASNPGQRRGLQMLNVNDDSFTNGPLPTNIWSEVKDIECGTDGSVHIAVTNKYYRKKSGESMFSLVTTPFSSPSRLEISISPSSPNVLYFLATGGDQLINGCWKTTDSGDTFTQIAGDGGGSSTWEPITQGDYALASAVHPTNEDMLFIGGLDCYRYTSSSGFVKISNWNYSITSPNYVHADIHNFIFRTDNPNAMYVVSDGGVNYTANSAASQIIWATKNTGYITTQFYSACAKNFSGELLGGTQDNGNWLIDFNGNTTRWGMNIKGGDGGDVAVSTINPNLLIAEYVYGDVARSSNNGASFGNMLDSHNDGDGDNEPNEGAPFISQFELWENLSDTNTQTQAKMALGTNKGVWLTQEALDLTKTPTWFDITAPLTAAVTSLDFTTDGQTLYFGTQSGTLYRIDGLSQLLAYTTQGTTQVFVPDSFGITTTMIKDFGSGRYITGIDVDVNNDDHIVVTLGNYGPADHVYESTNATSSTPTFTNIATAGNGLPSMPVYCCLIDKVNPDIILIGTEVGVYSTNDGGNNWTIEDENLPRNPVLKLYRYMLNDPNSPTGTVDNVILAATYGRGLFRTRTLQFTSAEKPPVVTKSKQLEIYPNPAAGETTVSVMLSQRTDLMLYVYALNGKLVKSVSLKNQTSGVNAIPLQTSDLSNGTYLINVKGSGINETRKLAVVR